ncbi:MAG: Maf family protein [Candidatus Zixiibacteriota bacterium]
MTYSNLHRLAQRYRLVLGSGSPRRFELLTELGVRFERIVPDLHESMAPGEHPYHFAKRLAEDKAHEVAIRLNDQSLVIGCDTIVVLGDQVLQKPIDEPDAARILSMLSGNAHVVCSAVALALHNRILESSYELTHVYFNTITASQIQDYIATGEPMDKAGAYGIQGMGAFLVDRIEGNLDTVVGLPRTLLDNLAGRVMSCVSRD